MRRFTKLAYNHKDHYYWKAKSNDFAARSIFKLEEIDRRFHIIKAGQKILDLGAAPGSWSQYISQKIGPHGRILGIDLQPVSLTLPNAVFITADLRDLNLVQTMQKEGISPPFDLVLSDMAPKTTGIKITDQVRSLELCELALETAEKYLQPNGHFVCKLFHSEDFHSFRNRLSKSFKRIEVIRPKSTRKTSKEIFFLALSYAGADNKGCDKG